MIRRIGLIWLLAMVLLGISGCSSNHPPPVPPPTETQLTPTPRPPLETQLRNAFRQPDPQLRRDQVVAAANAFLRDEAIRQTDDVIATTYFNDIAFSSGRLTLSDPAIIKRQGDQAIVLLPEGMGLYLFDSTLDDGIVELSRWTIGLNDLQVIWRTDELGVRYTTFGRDEVIRPHFILATRSKANWRLAWSSDETADWWFNAAGGELSVTDDLSQLRLTGEATNTTTDFYEQEGEPRREFAIVWSRQGDSYVMHPPLADFETRTAWFQAAAIPSPYATLVAFVERLEAGDSRGASELVSDVEVLQAVTDFGLNDPTRRYQIVTYEEQRIVFRDVQGTFVATFDPPTATGQPWLINQLVPFGSATPEPTATEESAIP